MNNNCSYSMTAGGLMEKDVLVCSPFEVLGKARRHDGTGWSHVVGLIDDDKNNHQILISSSELSDFKILVDKLTDSGLVIFNFSKKSAIANYIASASINSRFLIPNNSGWQGKSFYFPHTNKLVTTDDFKTINKSAMNCVAKNNIMGTLAEWNQKLGFLMKGNSNLILGFSTTLAAPLLKLLNKQNYGFNLVGKSSIGKTTCMEFAASLIGSTEKGNQNYVTNFRTTDNGLESVCYGHNDFCLMLDEFSQAQKISETVYLLGNGTTKGRASKLGEAVKRNQFNLTFLVSSELKLQQALLAKKESIKLGMEVRFIDIDVEIGNSSSCYEHLHGFLNGKELSDYIKQQTKSFYGSFYLEYINFLVADLNNNEQELLSKLNKWIDEFMDGELVKSDNEVISRILSSLAINYAAAMYAVENGLVGLNQKDLILGLTRFTQMIREVHANSNSESKHIVQEILDFILKNEKSRFDGTDESKIHNRAGTIKDFNGSKYFCIYKNVVNKEICSNYSPKQISFALETHGFLVRDSENRLTKNIYFDKDNPNVRCYCIDSKILEWDSDTNNSV